MHQIIKTLFSISLFSPETTCVFATNSQWHEMRFFFSSRRIRTVCFKLALKKRQFVLYCIFMIVKFDVGEVRHPRQSVIETEFNLIFVLSNILNVVTIVT